MVAIVVEAVLKIAKKAFKTGWHVVISVLAFVAIYFFHVPFPLIVFGAAICGIVFLKAKDKNADSNEQSKTENQKPKTRNRSLKIILVCFLLWLAPFLAVFFAFGFDSVPVQTYLFFTQAAFRHFRRRLRGFGLRQSGGRQRGLDYGGAGG